MSTLTMIPALMQQPGSTQRDELSSTLRQLLRRGSRSGPSELIAPLRSAGIKIIHKGEFELGIPKIDAHRGRG